MSANNGVYILQTPSREGGYEYRIKHLQAVRNVYWDTGNSEETNDQDVWIRNARMMWAGCRPYTNKQDAFLEADKIYSTIDSLEYGICIIKISRVFTGGENSERIVNRIKEWDKENNAWTHLDIFGDGSCILSDGNGPTYSVAFGSLDGWFKQEPYNLKRGNPSAE